MLKSAYVLTAIEQYLTTNSITWILWSWWRWRWGEELSSSSLHVTNVSIHLLNPSIHLGKSVLDIDIRVVLVKVIFVKVSSVAGIVRQVVIGSDVDNGVGVELGLMVDLDVEVGITVGVKDSVAINVDAEVGLPVVTGWLLWWLVEFIVDITAISHLEEDNDASTLV
jgi:hypothetical protein